jgi:hypothetical protein
MTSTVMVGEGYSITAGVSIETMRSMVGGAPPDLVAQGECRSARYVSHDMLLLYWQIKDSERPDRSGENEADTTALCKR